MIPFNKPYCTGQEVANISQVITSGKLSGDGFFTKKCQEYLENKYGFNKVLLTTSCTDALEMAAILINIQPGDEVILPSYTFVSTANAFALRGATLIFADSEDSNPNIDAKKLEALITDKTKAIVPVHYGGVACDMDEIMRIARKHKIFVIEDAAQGIDSYYKGKPVGSIGHLATFSFHETKNIICGEGGLLVINDKRLTTRAEIIRDKGTNRSSFFRGEVNNYGWVDIGSSFLPSELIAAFLYAQLMNMENIQARRVAMWNRYDKKFRDASIAALIRTPLVPKYATPNGHIYYILTNGIEQRNAIIEACKTRDIQCVFHYLSLHKSTYFQEKYHGGDLRNADDYTNSLLRLPLYYDLTDKQQDYIVDTIVGVLESSFNKVEI
jgi:dTDP-4-amino-4,6-dideoxygalactose transaminase